MKDEMELPPENFTGDFSEIILVSPNLKHLFKHPARNGGLRMKHSGLRGPKTGYSSSGKTKGGQIMCKSAKMELIGIRWQIPTS